MVVAGRVVPSQLRLENYGASLDGTGRGDDDALAAAVQDARDGTWSTCRIGWNGALTLTRPTPVLDRVHLEGDDVAGATVRKRYAGGALFRFEGRAGFTGGGLHNLSVPNDTGSPGSYLILSRASQGGYAADNIRLEHLYLAAGPREQAPFRTIELSGVERTSPAGIRLPWIQNVTCFGTTDANVYLPGLEGAQIMGLNLYPGFPDLNADLHLVSRPGFWCENNRVYGSDIEGTLHLSFQRNLLVSGSLGKVAWAGPCETTLVQGAFRPQEIGRRPATCRVV